MSASFEFVAPDHFTAGAIGPPGQRVFYLQSREKGKLVTLKSEKEQVRALAQYLSGLLEKLPAVGAATLKAAALLEPVDAVWIVASIAVGYDEARDRILVVANELLEDEEGDAASVRLLVTRAQAGGRLKQGDEGGGGRRGRVAR